MNLTSIDVGRMLVGLALGVTVGSTIDKFKNIALRSISKGVNTDLISKVTSLAQVGVGMAAIYYGIKYENSTFWKSLDVVLGLSQLYYGGRSLVGK